MLIHKEGIEYYLESLQHIEYSGLNEDRKDLRRIHYMHDMMPHIINSLQRVREEDNEIRQIQKVLQDGNLVADEDDLLTFDKKFEEAFERLVHTLRDAIQQIFQNGHLMTPAAKSNLMQSVYDSIYSIKDLSHTFAEKVLKFDTDLRQHIIWIHDESKRVNAYQHNLMSWL
ncbi:hypothetical protein H6504_04050 [Candidatus Woesearchaeota archaeon]|nr:hypothetical protein [Candidatus Woesearchaeota archaeon]